MGKVTKIYSDGDLRVTVDGQTWTFNPLCVHLMPGSATELNNTLQTNEREKRLSMLIIKYYRSLLILSQYHHVVFTNKILSNLAASYFIK
jgi:E3 ubiquitin-protein ligase mind-bomb